MGETAHGGHDQAKQAAFAALQPGRRILANLVAALAVFLLALFLVIIVIGSLFAADIIGTAKHVLDGDTFDIEGDGGTYRIRLHGIDTPEPGQKCKEPRGGTWRCGDAATKALTDLMAGAAIQCDDRGRDDYDRTLAVCFANRININKRMVELGLAWAFRRYSADYVPLEESIRPQGVGIWQTETQAPWDFRAERWQVAEQEAPKGCPIKGNIARDGVRIYHTPWSPWYGRTKLSVEKGEKWFCNEREALDAGWRAPIWGN